MLRSALYSMMLLLLSSIVAIAQPVGDSPIVEGDDGAKQAAERAAYLTDFHNYNAALNGDLSTKKIYHHHIDINRNQADIPGEGEVTKAIDCYFTYRDKEFVVKKILILTTNGKVSSTKEFTFDSRQDGELSYYAYNADINQSDSERTSFYFDSKQLMYYSEDGIVLPKSSYDDNTFKNGIEVLNTAEDFRLMLNTIIRVQAK